jgi:methionyl-tRNA formyltransferase
MLDGKMLKVYQSVAVADSPAPLSPGTWYSDGKQRLSLCCRDGWVDLLEVQLEGKKRMNTGDFLRGYRKS